MVLMVVEKVFCSRLNFWDVVWNLVFSCCICLVDVCWLELLLLVLVLVMCWFRLISLVVWLFMVLFMVLVMVIS